MKTELTNMVFIQDKATGKVVVQERAKDWVGHTFPGGHVLDGESFVDSAIREVAEETGLGIENLRSCGVVHWVNLLTSDRYLAFLYKTCAYTGELLPESPEGKNRWMTIDELIASPSENGLHEILYMFLHDEYSEAFGSWNGNDWRINEYK